jgi:hypothetical protein
MEDAALLIGGAIIQMRDLMVAAKPAQAHPPADAPRAREDQPEDR